jgi:ElaB/YqjD/DUF883 family membrane-anchored ribosome-binding protein
MEPYPHYYSRQSRMVDSSESSLKSMIDELQQMLAHLGERVEDRCGGLEHRIEEAEQHAKERLMSLEMSRTE